MLRSILLWTLDRSGEELLVSFEAWVSQLYISQLAFLGVVVLFKYIFFSIPLHAVPVTFAWRDELEKKANSAIHRALGQPPSSRGGGAVGRRNPVSQFDHMDDNKVDIIMHSDVLIFNYHSEHGFT